MATKTKVTDLLTEPDQLAVEVANLWVQWDSARNEWKERVEEVRRYVFSTDTTTTANSSLPWKNKTTIPKLCQIRDNLHANYMAALFPNDNWFTWEAKNDVSATKAKRDIIRSYIKNKTRNNDFKAKISDLVYDYIDFGNTFADVEYVRESYLDDDGIERTKFIGPRVIRVNPTDHVFDPTAAHYDEAPKITRQYYTMGELEDIAINVPEKGYYTKVISRMKEDRQQLANYNSSELKDDYNLQIAGMGSMSLYLKSGNVELLEFEGNFYDPVKMKYFPNHRIVVADRRHVIYNKPIASLHGKSGKVTCGWRKRPGNLMAMGPLENLVGMQYRIDHLENLKADAWDMIAFPMSKIKGEVQDFSYGPNAKIYVGEEGDVTLLHPDTLFLQADTQIAILEQKMEEMAGAPKQAMGFRTPGEKTAFEVSTLENAASRIFQSKIKQFEEQFLEPLLNNMLEVARRNMDRDTISMVDEAGAEVFRTITETDLRADGMIHPVGARHFAQKAQSVQNLFQFMNSALGQDPTVSAHISGLRIAEAMEELLELAPYNFVQEGIRLEEQASLQALAQQFTASLQRQQARPDPVEMALEEEV